MELKKTLKLKLIPLTKRDRAEAKKLLRDYRILVKEALQVIIVNDARSRKKAHDLCYRVLRERYPHLHNKFVEEAYKRALAMYKSYRKLVRKWGKRKLGQKPSPPSIKELRVVDLHIDVFRIDRHGDIYVLRISKDSDHYIRFIVVMYSYALNQLSNAGIGNSKLLFDGDEIYLLLTIIKDVEARNTRNKLYIDTNEDNVSVMLVDFNKRFASLFTIEYYVSRVRNVYRCIRRGIQKKVGNPYVRNRLLAKYGARERRRVEDRLKKTANILGRVAEVFNASLVRERLKDMKNGRRSKNRKLNYRLGTFPYRKLFTYLDTEFAERGLTIVEVDARGTSITCPVCGYRDKRNRISNEIFKCRKCGFTHNAHYVACLNLFTRLNDGKVAIRGEGTALITSETGQVVLVSEAPDDPTKNEWAPRGKPVPKEARVAECIKRS